MQGCDMIVNLTKLPEVELAAPYKMKRAFVGDMERILAFVEAHFQKNWVYEVQQSLLQSPSKCFVVTQEGKLIGFACYDASAKGFFGPIGVAPEKRGEGLGAALLLRTLHAMREDGYGYAIIGWVSEAEGFYRHTVNAQFIPGGEPENSVYSNLLFM